MKNANENKEKSPTNPLPSFLTKTFPPTANAKGQNFLSAEQQLQFQLYNQNLNQNGNGNGNGNQNENMNQNQNQNQNQKLNEKQKKQQQDEENAENNEEQQLLVKDKQQQITRVNFIKENAGGHDGGQTFTKTLRPLNNSSSSSPICRKIKSKIFQNNYNPNPTPNDHQNANSHQCKMPKSSQSENASRREEQQQEYSLNMANSSEEARHQTYRTTDGHASANTNGNGEEHNGNVIVLTPNSLNPNEKTASTILSPGGPNGTVNSNTSRHYHPDEPYKGPKLWILFLKHWTNISEQVALLAIFGALWAVAYFLAPQYALPHTGIMRIGFLFVGAQLTGIFVSLAHMPDMLGMLFFGVLYTNIGLADFTGYQPLEAFLREMALINIMLLAGLGLDAGAFRKLWAMIMRLTLVPTIAEVAVIAFLARVALQMPWLFGILLGLVVTAVSPNVVVTVMLKLKEERLGLNNGIHTLIYAMTTCNDVLAIFLFGVILGVIYSTGTLTEQILQGPIGIGIGVVFGSLYGLMLRYLPSRNAVYANGVRFVLIVLGGTISVIGSKVIGYPSAGALGCVAIAFVAGLGWKKEEARMTARQRRDYIQSSVPKRLDLLWKFLKPVSFALIGKEINFRVLEGKVVGYGILFVLAGSLFRLAFAYISTYGGNLTRKERAYITISGFPKATVQMKSSLGKSMDTRFFQQSLMKNWKRWKAAEWPLKKGKIYSRLKQENLDFLAFKENKEGLRMKAENLKMKRES